MAFYGDLVGLREMARAGIEVTLGTGDRAVVRLVEQPAASTAPARATGLFHTAVLFPDRASLATVVRHIASAQYPFTGASDHLVSEALYLDDPDGHGVELYHDRPQTEWQFDGGTVQMATLPLDVNGLLADATGVFGGAPPDTCVGHVHLKVDDVAGAERFFTEVVGLARTARYGDAASFFAADGYHHHFGANVWQSRRASPAPSGAVRLLEYVIETATRDGVDAFARRAEAAGIAVTRDGGRATIADPWGQQLVVGAP